MGLQTGVAYIESVEMATKYVESISLIAFAAFRLGGQDIDGEHASHGIKCRRLGLVTADYH